MATNIIKFVKTLKSVYTENEFDSNTVIASNMFDL